MAEIKEPTSMEKVNVAEANFARSPSPIGASFWRYVLHPQKYSQPEGLDLDVLKKSLNDPRVVLCLEVMFLTSRFLKEINEEDQKDLQAQAGQKGKETSQMPMPPTSLLSLWDDI